MLDKMAMSPAEASEAAKHALNAAVARHGQMLAGDAFRLQRVPQAPKFIIQCLLGSGAQASVWAACGRAGVQSAVKVRVTAISNHQVLM
jgi:hypothetical protein